MTEQEMWRRLCCLLICASLLGGRVQPARATTADDLCAASADPCVCSTTVRVDPNSVIDVGARELRLAAGCTLRLTEDTLTIIAGKLAVLVGGSINASGSLSSSGASVDVTANTVTVAGTIDVSGADAGAVALIASDGVLEISGQINAGGRSIDSSGGSVSLNGSTVHVLGGISAVGGAQGAGGSVDLGAGGDLTIAAKVDVAGGSPGGVHAEAGNDVEGGNLTVTATGILSADAKLSGESGGEIDLLAAGDGVETGHLVVDGQVRANGASGTEDTGGGLGGLISLRAEGNITGTAVGAVVSVGGGGPDGEGGELIVEADGRIDIAATMDASATALGTVGGVIGVMAGGDVFIRGLITAAGGGADGGEVRIESTVGSVTVASMSTINVGSALGGGFGGTLSLAAGSLDTARISVEGTLRGNGSTAVGFTGDGGIIDLAAPGEIVVTGTVEAKGGLNGGSGGAVAMTADSGAVRLEGTVNLDGNGGRGGSLQVAAGGPLSVRGPLNLRGAQGGGSLGLTSEGDVLVSAAVNSSAGSAVAPGGRNELSGCAVDLTGSGTLQTGGVDSANIITGRGTITIAGTMRAGALNEIRFAPGPSPRITGSILPAPQFFLDGTLSPCAPISPSPTGTVTATPDGSQATPTPSPTTTPTLAACTGDCNALGTVTIDELVRGVNIALGATLLDTCPAFDANADEQVTVDELVRGVNNALNGCPAG